MAGSAGSVSRPRFRRFGSIGSRLLGSLTEPFFSCQIQKSLNEIKLNNIKEQKNLKESFLWGVDTSAPYDLILAGDILFHGGLNEVTAFDSINGNEVWSADIKGKAYGLAFSHGTLLVSTTLGHIYAFSP